MSKPSSDWRPCSGSTRLVATLVAVLFCACAAPSKTDVAPQGCGPQREFHVVSHGWHSGVVIRGADLETRLPEIAASVAAAGLVELGWGDAAFYRAPQPTAALALRAVLYPTAAVLHVVAVPDTDLTAHFPGSSVVTLSVPESGYGRMLDHLVETFERAPDGGLIALEPGLYGESRFYRATGSFHAFNTCNTWVARAVAATGYPLRNTAVVTAEALLDELRRGTGAPCFTAD